MALPSLSLVMPTWNGRKLLEQFLPSVVEACRTYGGTTEILVVDDGSIDDTQEFLGKYFSGIRLLKLAQNHGYGYASNYGVEQSRYDWIILLNNDVFVKDDFLQYLPGYFEEEDVFAVRIRVFPLGDKKALESGVLKPPTLWIRGEWANGFIYVPSPRTCLLSEAPDQGRYAFSVGAGAFCVNKKKWQELGGFDDLFHPFYVEETDLAYRALKRGWKIVYEPRSVVYHQEGHATTFRAKKRWYISLVGERNLYFLVWKNILDPEYLLIHIMYLPLRLAKNLVEGKWGAFLGFFCALMSFGKVLRRRIHEKKEMRRRDREIFDYFKL